MDLEVFLDGIGAQNRGWSGTVNKIGLVYLNLVALLRTLDDFAWHCRMEKNFIQFIYLEGT